MNKKKLIRKVELRDVEIADIPFCLVDTLFEVKRFFVFFCYFNVSICSTVRSMERESNQGQAPSGCSLKSARSLDYFPPPYLT